jgi:hypothetical protein
MVLHQTGLPLRNFPNFLGAQKHSAISAITKEVNSISSFYFKKISQERVEEMKLFMKHHDYYL